MNDHQLQYLRFLQMKEQFPELNHRGHEPGPDLTQAWEEAKDTKDLLKVMELRKEREQVEREFNRLRLWKPRTAEEMHEDLKQDFAQYVESVERRIRRGLKLYARNTNT